MLVFSEINDFPVKDSAELQKLRQGNKQQINKICSQFTILSSFVSTCWWQQGNNKENAYHLKSLPVRELYSKSLQEIPRKPASP